MPISPNLPTAVPRKLAPAACAQSSISAIFAERPICPYCDGPLVRRNDDDAGVLKKRLEEFGAKTQPLVDFYEKAGTLRKVDGNRDRDAVFGDISALIEQKA